MTTQFIHLHTHSHYSLLEGLSKIKPLVERAKKNKMTALALTDSGNMYGAIEFYKECVKNDIKPIIGVDAYITPGKYTEKVAGVDNIRHRITLLAKDIDGYKNLMRLVSIAHTEGFYYKARIDKDLLRKYKKGIVCLSGGFESEISKALRGNKKDLAEKVAEEYFDIFGKDYYIEIQHHPNLEQAKEVRAGLMEIGEKLDIPVVATQDSYYLDPDDAPAQDVHLAVGQGVDIHNDNRFTMSNEDYSFIDSKTASEYFKDYPDVVKNTAKVANKCKLELDLGKWTFPAFTLDNGRSFDEQIRRRAYKGIKRRGLKETKELTDRLDYELKVIKDKNYSVYFLVVEDLMYYARKNNIFTTIRGSVAGSMATYLLGITNVNPFEYKIPFERFLNPERPSAPDIDMDFADNRRDEVLDYAREKYGKEKVAQIGTFGKMLAKGAVRDVARAMGYPYSVGDKIAKMIPLGSQGFPMTIKRAVEMEPDLEKAYVRDPATKEIIEMAKKIEGCARHISVHAAGAVIAPTELTDFVPIQVDPKGGKLITQYDMHGVEDAGLIKFDFLGIRNLAILGDAVRLVKKFRDIDVDIENIPMNNEKTFEMLARGDTIGLFQLNGAGMTKWLKELRPTRIQDINAMVALYRPGAMNFIGDYIKRKRDPKLITYLDPRMKAFLEGSLGLMIYQDDVMMIAIELAGYSWLEADKFRKAMGKKIPKLMQEQKEKFIKGCIEHKMEEHTVKQLWSDIEKFAAYGFNKAHSASYGRVAYQTAYMKANYPAEYMCAVLTAESGDVEKIAEIIHESKRLNIPVLPPDINESLGNFVVIKGDCNHEEKTCENGDKIRFGLYTIKNFGYDIGDAIIAEREENGPYKSFSEFLERVHHKNLNKKSLDALIKTGAMDNLGERGQMLSNMESALEYNKHIINIQASNQTSLFGGLDESSMPGFQLKESDPATMDEKLIWEKELLGLYISGHPLDKYREKIKKMNASIKQVQEKEGKNITCYVAGAIDDVKEIITKKGDKMAFAHIADHEYTLEVVVFPRTFKEFKEILIPGMCIVIKGKISKRNDELSIVVDDMKKLI